ncbi:hypothetical protein AAMO2058_001387800 [Amorphochlora amoebiformis]
MTKVVNKVEKEGYKIPLDKRLLPSRNIPTDIASDLKYSEEKYLSIQELYSCYDCFKIQGSDFSIFLTNGGPSWRKHRIADLVAEERAAKELIAESGNTPLALSSSPSTLLSPIDLKIEIYKTVAPGVSALPRVRVEGKMEIVDLALTPSKYGRVMKILKSYNDSQKTITASTRKRTSKRVPKAKGEKDRTKKDKKDDAKLNKDTSGLNTSILDAKENQTYADLKHALGNLPDTDPEAKALLDKAKDLKGGVPVAVIKEWWEKRMHRLERVTTIILDFTIGKVRLSLSRDGKDAHTPTVGLVVANLKDLGLCMGSRYFDSRTLVTLSEIQMEDLENPFGQICTNIIKTRAHKPNASPRGGSGDSFVKIALESVQPDSPSIDTYPCTSNTSIFVGQMNVILEPHRVQSITSFLLYDFLGTKSQTQKPSVEKEAKGASGDRLGLQTILQGTEISGNVDPEEEKDYYYLRKLNLRMNLRSQPTTDPALKTGVLIEPGSVFKAVDRIEGKDGNVFLKVQSAGESVGWAFMNHPKNGSSLVIPFSETKVDREEVRNNVLEASFSELNIQMVWRGTAVSSAAVKTVEAKMIQYRFSQSIQLKLSQVLICDCTKDGRVYPNAVETLALPDEKGNSTGKSDPCLISILYNTYNPHEKAFPGFCTDIQCSFRGLRVVYTARFIDEITSFFTKGPFAEIGQPSDAYRGPVAPVTGTQESKAAEDPLVLHPDGQTVSTSLTTSRQTMGGDAHVADDGYTNPAKTFSRIRLTLSAVELWVPESSLSENKLTARIESILVSNHILSHDIKDGGDKKEEKKRKVYPTERQFAILTEGRKFQRFSVELSRFSISSHTPLTKSTENGFGVAEIMELGPVEVLKDALSDRKFNLSGLWINLGQVKTVLNQKQYQMIIKLLSANLGEGKSIVIPPKTSTAKFATERGESNTVRFEAKSEVNSSFGNQLSAPERMPRESITLEERLVQDISVIDVILPKISVHLKFGGGEEKEKDFMMLSLFELAVNIRNRTQGGKTAGTTIVTCKGLSMRDNLLNPHEKQTQDAFREILSVEVDDNWSLDSLTGKRCPVTFAVTQAGGVDLEQLAKGFAPEIIPSLGADYRLDIDCVRLILEKSILDLSSFFVIPGDIIQAGWVDQEPNSHIYTKHIRRFITLERIDQGSSLPPRHQLKYAIRKGGVPTGSIDLAEFSVSSKEEDAFVLSSDATTYVFHLPSTADRDSWVESLDKAIRDGRGSKDMSSSKSKQSIQTSQKNPADAPPMVFRVTVFNPCIILVRKPFEEKTDGLLLTWTMDAEYKSFSGPRGGSSFSGALDNLQVQKANLDTTKPIQWFGNNRNRDSGLQVNAQPLIEPLRVWIHNEQFISPLHALIYQVLPPTRTKRSKDDLAPGGQVNTVRVSPLIVRLRYMDYKLLMNVVEDYSAKLSRKTTGDDEEEDIEKLPIDEGAGQETQPDSDEGGDEKMIEPKTQSKRGKIHENSESEEDAEPANAPTQGWSIVLENISATLINDAASFDVPIARLSIRDVEMKLHGVAHGLRMLVQLNLQAEYHNNRHLRWEPMIEPWQVTFRALSAKEPLVPSFYSFLPGYLFHSESSLRSKARSFLSITSDKPLDMNLTAGMVASVQQSVALLTDNVSSEQKEAKLARIHRDAYKLINETEFPISFTINTDQTTRRCVLPGGRAYFNMANTEAKFRDSDGLFIAVGQIPPQVLVEPLIKAKGHELHTVLDKRSRALKMSIMGYFPSRGVLKEQMDWYLRLFLDGKETFVSDPNSNRHFPVWADVYVDKAIIKENTILKIEVHGSEILMLVEMKFSEFSKLPRDHMIPLTDHRGTPVGAHLNLLQTPHAIEKTGISWVWLPGYDIQEKGRDSRPDLLGNYPAMMKAVQETGAVAFTNSGNMYSKGELKKIRQFDSYTKGVPISVLVSLEAFKDSSDLVSRFRDTDMFVFSITSLLTNNINNGYVDLRVHTPTKSGQSDIKAPQDLADLLEGNGTIKDHTHDRYDIIAQGDHLGSNKFKFRGGEVYYSSEISHGLKVITLHSKYLLKNSTSNAIGIMVTVNGQTIRPTSYPYNKIIPPGQDPEAWTILEPGKGDYLPVLVNPLGTGPPRDIRVYFAPVGTGEDRKRLTAWSRPGIPVGKSKELDCKMVCCDGPKPFFANAELKTRPNGVEFLRFLPVVVIKNLLPDGLNFVWRQQRRSGGRTVGVGDDYSIHEVDPELEFSLRIQMLSISKQFSRPVSFPPVSHFLKDGDTDTPKRHLIQVPIVDEEKRELRISVEVAPTALKVVINLFAPFWIFDTTNLNLTFSEDRDSLPPNRTVDVKQDEKKVPSELEGLVDHARLMSFTSSSTKLFLRADPERKSKKMAPVPRCPRNITEGTNLDKIALSLKKARAYLFERGERLLYHYNPYVENLDDCSSCVILTSKALASIHQWRLKERVQLSLINKVTHKPGGAFSPDEVIIHLKTGRSKNIEIPRSTDAARFFTAMTTYICDQALQNQGSEEMKRSEWSQKPVHANGVGTEGLVELPALLSTFKSRHKVQYEIGYSISAGSGEWRRTRIIKFVPRYFILNNTNLWLQLAQKDTGSSDDMISIEPESSSIFHWPSTRNEKTLRFRCFESKGDIGSSMKEVWSWSSYFAIHRVVDVIMRLRNRNTFQDQYARVEIRNGGATLFIVVSLIDPNSDVVLPYRIENRCTREAFHIRQVGVHPHVNPGSATGDFLKHAWMLVQPYTYISFAMDDVMNKNNLEIALDNDHSDSIYKSDHVIVNLDRDNHKSIKLKLKPAIQGWSPYHVYISIEYDGPTKVVVISEDFNKDRQINPFTLAPLDEKMLPILQDRLAMVQSSRRFNSQKLHELRLDKKFVSEGNSFSRRRPREIPADVTAVRLQILRVENVSKSPLYCIIQFGSERKRKINLKTVARNTSAPSDSNGVEFYGLRQKRDSTILRVTLMVSNPLWTDECLGIIEFTLGDFRSHKPVRKRFHLKPCTKTSESPGDNMPWITPPSAVSSKSTVGGLVGLDVWWVPRDSGSIQNKIKAFEKRLFCRERVSQLLQPKLDISHLQNNFLDEQRRKLLAKRVPKSEAEAAAGEMAKLGDARFSIKLLDVRGRALHAYNLTDTKNKGSPRLCCLVTVTATGESICSVLCEGGEKVINRWHDSLTFDLPKAFLAKAASGDQRGRVTLLFYVETPRRSPGEVGFDVIKLGIANLQLSEVMAKSYEKAVAGALDTNEAFRKTYSYDPVRAQGQSWSGTKYRWLTIGLDTSEEISALVYCQRLEGSLPERSTTTLSLALPRIGLSLVDQKPRELLYLSISDPLVLYSDSEEQETVEVCIGKVQIDNQMPGFSFPFILAPKPIADADKPMLQFGVNRSKDDPGGSAFTLDVRDESPLTFITHNPNPTPGSGLPTIRVAVNPAESMSINERQSVIYSYVGFLLQEFEVNFEEELYWTLLSFADEITTDQQVSSLEGDHQSHTDRWVQPSTISYSDTYNIPAGKSQVLTIGLLHLQSMVVKISFEISPHVRRKGLLLDLPFDPTALLMSLFGSTLGSIEDMKIHFDSILMRNVHSSTSSMKNTLIRHYKTDLLAQWYKVVFGFEILGNPVGMMENMADGVMSFFIEPAKGVIEDPGLLGFGKGLAKGSSALIESAITSAFGAAGMVTGSLSKGLAVLSMDDEFIKQNKQSNKTKPKHLGEGLLAGAKSVGMGVFGGVSGIFVDPIKGAKKDGVEGFFKGVGKGLLGVVAKPTAGVVNATSQALKSVGNTATFVLGRLGKQKKARFPRYVPENCRSLPPFSYSFSLGEHLLRKKKKKNDAVILGAFVTNLDTLGDELGNYASPDVTAEEHKDGKRTKVKTIPQLTKHAVVFTSEKVLVECLKHGIEWTTVADTKYDRIRNVKAGKAQGKYWGVQVDVAQTREKGKQFMVWCKNQEEAEMVKANFISRINYR